MAARKEYIGAMRILINAGADVNFIGPAGMTALMWCAWNGNIAGLELILRAPALETNMLSEVCYSANTTGHNVRIIPKLILNCVVWSDGIDVGCRKRS